MPEIKNTFTQGKMNKDLDERIIPSGQYRDALNVKVGTSDDASVGTVQNILGNKRLESFVPGTYTCIASVSDEKTNNLYWFVTKQDQVDAILQYNLDDDSTKVVLVDVKQDTLKFTQKIITGINVLDDLLFWTDNNSEPKKININTCIAGTSSTDLDTATHTQLIVNGVSKGDINESHITVIKKNPKNILEVKAIQPTSNTSTKLFEKIFPRFSYRYKYQDGEYSAFGPFTDVVFNAFYPEPYGKADAYSSKESYNTAMLNNVKSIELSNFVTSQTPKDVVEVEILYKQEGSSVIFSIKKIKYGDDIWNNNLYTVKSESIYAAIPSNQSLRSWDNLPKKALAQEITGNRLVYGNYTQGYDLIDSTGVEINTELLSADYEVKNSSVEFNNGGIPSIKSQRKYQVGIVYGDIYGRETTVFTSDNAFVEVPWFNYEKPSIEKSASKALQITANLNTPPPNWADYYKYYIKETSSEYYNLIMDRAYIPSKLNVFDDEDDHIWVSFPSSERNKITEEDYIILKKRVGGGEEQVNIENKFKVLDISNEAPDAIKNDYLNIGEASQTFNGGSEDLTDLLLKEEEFRIDQETDMIYVHRATWVGDCGGGSLTDDGDNSNMYVSNMYMSFRTSNSSNENETSERYKVVSILYVNQNYQIKLNRKITLIDAQLADINEVANDIITLLNPDLILTFERKEQKDLDEFSGKFFVKIVASKAAVNNIQNTEEPDILSNFVVTIKKPIRWYVDQLGTNYNPSTGVINSTFPTTTFSNHARIKTINTGKDITNTEAAWSAVMTNNSAHAGTGNYVQDSRTFFIDNSYFVAGQWSESNYVKNSGQTWGGSYSAPQLKKLAWGNYGGFWDFYTVDTGINNYPVYSVATGSSPLVFSWNGNDGIDADRYVNGMEGFVASTGVEHTADVSTHDYDAFKGYRRWKSTNPNESSPGMDLT